MSWVQFHFKCRFFLQKINEGLTAQQTQDFYKKSDLATLYSEQDLTGIQKELFDKIYLISSITGIKRALSVFSSIDLGESLASSKTYKSIIVKLGYLEAITLVFVIFITIYKLYVYPVFYDLIQQYPGLGDASFDLIASIFLLGLTVAVLTFMFTISYRQYIKNIDRLVINLPNKYLKFLIPKNVMVEITKLNNIITTPLDKNRFDDAFSNKVDAINKMGLDESVELKSLFIHHSNKLESVIWQNSTRMFGLMYALITTGIGFCITQIYEPIFRLGAIIE